MEFFLKHQTIIFRSVGAFLLVLGLTLFFWAAPQKVMTENEKAAANLARMEAAMSGSSSSKSSSNSQAADSSKISEVMAETQKKQLRMLMIMVMVFGAGFLGYSFFKKGDKEEV